MRIRKYYSLATKDREASIYIFGDIVSWEWTESDVSSYTLAKEIEGLDVDVINVYINSYGGEVAEGLAIYNQLRRHKAKVKTYCEGFACSAASVVFMAGDERVMSNASLLMIHNAWLVTWGDMNQLRKEADDLETINAAAIQAYMNHINISEEELKAMLDAETWISAADALEMGFATTVAHPATTDKAAASLRQRQQIRDAILNRQPQHGLIDIESLVSRLKEMMQREKPVPTHESEPEPRGKDLFVFLAALANKLREGAE